MLGMPCLLLWSLASIALDEGRDWPCWRGPQREGISLEKEWNAEGASEPLWTRELGLGYSNVAISANRLFTLGFDEKASEDVLYALDAKSGAELWRHTHAAKKWDNMHEGGTLTTPVVADERVFVMSRVGKLFALACSDGSVAWERDLTVDSAIETGTFGIPSSPLIIDGVIYLNVGRVLALRAETGESVWSTEDYGYSYATPTPFSWKQKECLAVFNAVGLVIIDRSNGSELSRHEWKSQYNVNCASPIVIGDQVFISTGYNELGCAMLQLAETQMKLLWQNKEMRSKMNGCVYFQGHLYGFDAGILKCIRPDGTVCWSERGLGMGTVLIAGDRLIVLSETGELLIAPANAESFAPIQRKAVLADAGKCWTSPVLAHGLIYVRASRGKLVCLDHRSRAGAPR